MAEKLATIEEEKRRAVADKKAMSKFLDVYLRKSAAERALSAAGAFGKVLLPQVIARTKVITDSKGRYLLRVVDESGEERFGSDGKPMTVDAFVAEMQQSDEYGFAFESHGATCSNTGSLTEVNPWSKKSFNATEQAKILKSHPEYARQSQQQAETDEPN
jgi:hypothetical protein